MMISAWFWFQHTAARRRLAPTSATTAKSRLSFNTQPPEGGWIKVSELQDELERFQHTAARRRLDVADGQRQFQRRFQHTAARRRLGGKWSDKTELDVFQHTADRRRLGLLPLTDTTFTGFNTQPPEGGWIHARPAFDIRRCFNTQPPEGGWGDCLICPIVIFLFQHTAARRRLGGVTFVVESFGVFQHTAARRRLALIRNGNSRFRLFQHTAARRRLEPTLVIIPKAGMFQHTAARRRLDLYSAMTAWGATSFNTQPPEGGWPAQPSSSAVSGSFQHTAARRRLDSYRIL